METFKPKRNQLQTTRVETWNGLFRYPPSQKPLFCQSLVNPSKGSQKGDRRGLLPGPPIWSTLDHNPAPDLGPPVVPFYPFLGGFLKIEYRKQAGGPRDERLGFSQLLVLALGNPHGNQQLARAREAICGARPALGTGVHGSETPGGPAMSPGARSQANVKGTQLGAW